MDTREYAIEVINTLSDEQVTKVIELILAFQQEKKVEEQPKKTLTARGALHKYANPAMIPFEKDAWEGTAVEKYAKNQNT